MVSLVFYSAGIRCGSAVCAIIFVLLRSHYLLDYLHPKSR